MWCGMWPLNTRHRPPVRSRSTVLTPPLATLDWLWLATVRNRLSSELSLNLAVDELPAMSCFEEYAWFRDDLLKQNCV